MAAFYNSLWCLQKPLAWESDPETAGGREKALTKPAIFFYRCRRFSVTESISVLLKLFSPTA